MRSKLDRETFMVIKEVQPYNFGTLNGLVRDVIEAHPAAPELKQRIRAIVDDIIQLSDLGRIEQREVRVPEKFVPPGGRELRRKEIVRRIAFMLVVPAEIIVIVYWLASDGYREEILPTILKFLPLIILVGAFPWLLARHSLRRYEKMCSRLDEERREAEEDLRRAQREYADVRRQIDELCRRLSTDASDLYHEEVAVSLEAWGVKF